MKSFLCSLLLLLIICSSCKKNDTGGAPNGKLTATISGTSFAPGTVFGIVFPGYDTIIQLEGDQQVGDTITSLIFDFSTNWQTAVPYGVGTPPYAFVWYKKYRLSTDSLVNDINYQQAFPAPGTITLNSLDLSKHYVTGTLDNVVLYDTLHVPKDSIIINAQFSSYWLTQ